MPNHNLTFNLTTFSRAVYLQIVCGDSGGAGTGAMRGGRQRGESSNARRAKTWNGQRGEGKNDHPKPRPGKSPTALTRADISSVAAVAAFDSYRPLPDTIFIEWTGCIFCRRGKGGSEGIFAMFDRQGRVILPGYFHKCAMLFTKNRTYSVNPPGHFDDHARLFTKSALVA